MKPLTQTVKEQLEPVIQPGDLCIDATAGNGHDTLFLAEQVGPHGHVYAFDIQATALANTRKLLAHQHQLRQASLIKHSHENLIASLPDNSLGKISAIMFNLGYLPGSDKTCITQPGSTLRALEQSLQLLKPEGIVSIMLYPNHSGGKAETETVYAWAEKLSRDYQQQTIKTPGPQWLKIQKL